MISFIRGLVADIHEDSIIIEQGGLGISVLVPFYMLDPRPTVDHEIFLYTHLQIKEDAWTLYGFSSRDQLTIFRSLLNVSGVGAKTSLAIVNKISVAHFSSVIAAQDIAPFTAVSGVGKKTAERILLELKDKFSISGVGTAPLPEDVSNRIAADKELLAALRQLGYSATEARNFVFGARQALGETASDEQLLREALRIAMKS